MKTRPTMILSCEVCSCDVIRKNKSRLPVLCKVHRRERWLAGTRILTAQDEGVLAALQHPRVIQVPRFIYSCMACGADIISATVLKGIVACDNSCRVRYVNRDTVWQQRTSPVNEWEQVAVDAYAERGMSCLWMPAHAPFDFVVNGHRVDVKGSEIGKRDGPARWAFELCNGISSYSPDELCDRCDIYHLVGRQPDGSFVHFFIPSADLNGRTQVSIPAVPENASRWRWYEGLWGALERGAPADAATLAATSARDNYRAEHGRLTREVKERRAAAVKALREERSARAKEVGQQLRQERNAAGLLAKQLVPYVDCGLQAIFAIERGRIKCIEKWAGRYRDAIAQALADRRQEAA